MRKGDYHMKKIIPVIIALLCCILLIPFLFRDTYSKHHRSVVCTTSIIADAVHAITQGQIHIKTLMGPGVDPHIYRPRESDVRALSEADLIFYNGLHLEGKMADMFVQMSHRIPTYAVSNALPKHYYIESDFEGVYDPHVWHDVSLWSNVVTYIRDALIAIDPEHSEVYTRNAQCYYDELVALQAYLQQKLMQLSPSKRELLTAHDAFAYFGRAYGFRVVGLQGISTDAMVSTRGIQSMADRIAHKKIKAIFLESSIPSKSIEAVQRAVASRGWHVAIAPELYSDSLGDKSTTAETYCGMMKHNVDVIVDSLS